MRKGNMAIVLALLAFPGFVWAQAQQIHELVIDGQSGQAPVVQVNGRNYVDVEALARITNGSMAFRGNQVVLTLSGAPAASSPAAPQNSESALSQNFMKAGIEFMGSMREWATVIADAVRNGYHISAPSVAEYQAKASRSLQLASASATTNGDQNGVQLLQGAFQLLTNWSDRLVQASQNMDTAKYSMSPGSLRNDPQSQQIIKCGQFLATMLGSGNFQDDASCH